MRSLPFLARSVKAQLLGSISKKNMRPPEPRTGIPMAGFDRFRPVIDRSSLGWGAERGLNVLRNRLIDPNKPRMESVPSAIPNAQAEDKDLTPDSVHKTRDTPDWTGQGSSHGLD